MLSYELGTYVRADGDVADFKPSPLSGQMDLISLFGLMPMYDTFLRPYLPDSVTVSGNESSGKGKEKAVEPAATASSSGGMKITFGGIKIGEVELDNKPKKLKVEKHYSSLVRDIPGAFVSRELRQARAMLNSFPLSLQVATISRKTTFCATSS